MLGIFHLVAMQSDPSTGFFVENLTIGQADLKGVVKLLLFQLFLQLGNCVGIILVLRIQLSHFKLGGIGKAAVCQSVQDLLRLLSLFGKCFLTRRFFSRRFFGGRFLNRHFLNRHFLNRHFLNRHFLSRAFPGGCTVNRSLL